MGRSPGGGHGNPLQYSCLENPQGQRSLLGYRPWDCEESDMTEQLRCMPAFLALHIHHYIWPCTISLWIGNHSQSHLQRSELSQREDTYVICLLFAARRWQSQDTMQISLTGNPDLWPPRLNFLNLHLPWLFSVQYLVNQHNNNNNAKIFSMPLISKKI